MERLSALDTSFLQMETPSAHMHVGWMSYVEPGDGAPLDVDRLVTQVESRLPSVPRFAQRVSWPSSLLDPVWIEDPAFDARAHVDVIDGARPVRRTEARRQCDG